MKPILISLFFIFNINWTTQAKIDKSSEIFFPPLQGQMLKTYQDLPLSWWNFLFFPKQISREDVCREIALLDKNLFLFNPCSEMPFHNEWLNPLSISRTLSSPPPLDLINFKQELDKALVQLSLPLPQEILEHIMSNPLINLEELTQGFAEFYKPPGNPSEWQNLAFLFRFSPEDVANINRLSNHFKNNKNIHWVGPFFGALENQQRIIEDLKKVSLITITGLFFLFLSLYLLKQKTYLFLIPLLGISIGIATIAVHYVFDSIHGLTIAFGSGLIGISMDYAFHGWKENHNPFVWSSNLIGFLTSFGAFILLSFFSIPLIKQMSLFSCIGLSASFLFCYLLSCYLPNHYKPQTLKITIPSFNYKTTLTIGGIIVLSGSLSFLFSKADFSLERMDYSRSKLGNSSLSRNLKNFKNEYAFIYVQKENEDILPNTQRYLEQHNIPFLSPYSFLTSEKEMEINFKDWLTFVCSERYESWPLKKQEPYSTLFFSFFNNFNCHALQTINEQSLKALKALFSSNNKIIGIAKLSDIRKVETLEKLEIPYFLMTDITKNFPQRIKTEIKNFSILIIILILGILVFFFRNKAPFALIPVIGAISFVFIGLYLIGSPLSLMSFVSIIILLGLSLDYGIFCTSYLLKSKPLSTVYGSIAMSAATSIIGFVPLCFCKHPVLFDIGVTITLGLVGATLMTALIFPMLETKGIRK